MHLKMKNNKIYIYTHRHTHTHTQIGYLIKIILFPSFPSSSLLPSQASRASLFSDLTNSGRSIKTNILSELKELYNNLTYCNSHMLKAEHKR